MENFHCTRSIRTCCVEYMRLFTTSNRKFDCIDFPPDASVCRWLKVWTCQRLDRILDDPPIHTALCRVSIKTMFNLLKHPLHLGLFHPFSGIPAFSMHLLRVNLFEFILEGILVVQDFTSSKEGVDVHVIIVIIEICILD